jgi:hypothetical protein
MVSGLRYNVFLNNYFGDNPSWFQQNISNINAFGVATDFTSISTATSGTMAIDGYAVASVEWTGLFTPLDDGVHTFHMSSDDASYLWIGAAANTPTTALAIIDIGGTHPMLEKSATMTLQAHVEYPIRIQFGNDIEYGNFMFSFTPPGGTRTYDGAAYLSSSVSLLEMNLISNQGSVNASMSQLAPKSHTLILSSGIYPEPISSGIYPKPMSLINLSIGVKTNILESYNSKTDRVVSFFSISAGASNTNKFYDYNALFSKYGTTKYMIFAYAGKMYRLLFNPAENFQIRNTSLWRSSDGGITWGGFPDDSIPTSISYGSPMYIVELEIA